MRTFRTSVVLAMAVVGIGVGSARADEAIVVKVPFPFVVHDETLPAGRYRVVNEEGVMMVRGLDNRAAIVAMTIQADGRDPAGANPALVFVRRENAYVLSQVWESGGEGLAVKEPSSHAGRRAAKSAAAGDMNVVVAASMA